MIQLGRRFISCFDKKTEQLIKEIPLSGITLTKLREVFKWDLTDEDDPMYDEFPIAEIHASQLAPYSVEPIELDKYDCFLSCSAFPIVEP